MCKYCEFQINDEGHGTGLPWNEGYNECNYIEYWDYSTGAEWSIVIESRIYANPYDDYPSYIILNCPIEFCPKCGRELPKEL